MQRLRLVLVLITIGCILGPVGTVVVMYRNNLSGLVVTPQLKQSFGNINGNSNNNGNNNYSNNNNNNYSNNNNNNNFNNNNVPNNPNPNTNSGNVNNYQQPVNNPTNNYDGSYQFDVTIPNNVGQIQDTMAANVNCAVEQNGTNGIGLSLDLMPTNVPNDLQSVFSSNNDYVFNFLGPVSGTQIEEQNGNTYFEASAQGSFSSGQTFDLILNGTISQSSLTITLSPASDTQVGITTPQALNLYINNNNNNSNNSNNSSNPNNTQNPSSNDNSSNTGQGGINPSFTGGQINTSQKKITLTFSIINQNNQDATLNSMSGTVEITSDNYQLGSVSLQSAPITIHAGQTSTVTVSGSLTSGGQNDLSQHFSGVSSVDVTVINAQMTVNGVSNSQSGSQDLGSVNVIS